MDTPSIAMLPTLNNGFLPKRSLVLTVQTMSNTQNDCVKKTETAEGTYCYSSDTVSKLVKTDPVFVQTRAKLNGVCYCDLVLEQGLLPDIRHLSNDDFLFQQDGALAHRSRYTVAPCAGVH